MMRFVPQRILWPSAAGRNPGCYTVSEWENVRILLLAGADLGRVWRDMRKPYNS